MLVVLHGIVSLVGWYVLVHVKLWGLNMIPNFKTCTLQSLVATMSLRQYACSRTLFTCICVCVLVGGGVSANQVIYYVDTWTNMSGINIFALWRHWWMPLLRCRGNVDIVVVAICSFMRDVAPLLVYRKEFFKYLWSQWSDISVLYRSHKLDGIIYSFH